MMMNYRTRTNISLQRSSIWNLWVLFMKLPLVFLWQLRRGSTLSLPPNHRCDFPRSFIKLHTHSAELILRLCDHGNLQEALSLLFASTIQQPSQVYGKLLHACTQCGLLSQGKALHEHILHSNHKPDLFVSNHLINMYAKCGCLDLAHQVFDDMLERNVVSWTALITGYDQQGQSQECYKLFKLMLSSGYPHRPNEFTLASVLSSCANLGDEVRGQQVHALAHKISFDANVFVGNALINMYSRCQDKDRAWLVFLTLPQRNLVTWNSMISAFQLLGHGEYAFGLFLQMRRMGIVFDHATLVSLLSSSLDLPTLKPAYQLHSLLTKTGFAFELEVASMLVKVYSKLGSAEVCYQVFKEMQARDIISWTGIITVFAEQEPGEALLLFRQLRGDGLTPDRFTFSIILKACSNMASELHGEAIHAQIVKVGFEADTVISNALIHTYGRCGNVSLAACVFDRMHVRDIISWNTMIKAYAMHGLALQALQLFERMDFLPDPTTFVGLLSACSHAGLVIQGRQLFDKMIEQYGVVPQKDHFACMVDILGRAGSLNEAEDLINRMPIEPDSVVWAALLGACRKHKNTEIGERASHKLLDLEPQNSAGYVLMSNIYCATGSWADAAVLRKEMKENKAKKKEPGLSWIEIDNQVHNFTVGGTSHPQQEAILAKIMELIGRLKEKGYVPLTELVLHEIEEEHKEEHLYYHSEKLALVFGLMNSRGSVIRIMKNIRICEDCHNFIKFASNDVKREIIVRDANRFHHFRDGLCSCRDYW